MYEVTHPAGKAVHGVPTIGDGPLERWLAPSSQSRVERIPVAVIMARPIADHDDGDAASFIALMASVEARGILEPLLLSPTGGGSFVVVCGARRLRAARRLGLTVVPAIVREFGDVDMLLTGAWQALHRFGIAPGDAPALERRLIAGGLHAAEAAALVAAIPLRTATEGRDTPGDDLPAMRFLRPGIRFRRPAGQPAVPSGDPPPGLLLPVDAATIRLLAEALPPTSGHHMAA